jgi:hypothetical protein
LNINAAMAFTSRSVPSTPTAESMKAKGYQYRDNEVMKSASTKAASKLFPILDWFPKYSSSRQLVPDVIAGITTGTMAVPQSMSYALIAGLPPQYGLYSDIQFCYPILGTSKVRLAFA